MRFHFFYWWPRVLAFQAKFGWERRKERERAWCGRGFRFCLLCVWWWWGRWQSFIHFDFIKIAFLWWWLDWLLLVLISFCCLHTVGLRLICPIFKQTMMKRPLFLMAIPTLILILILMVTSISCKRVVRWSYETWRKREGILFCFIFDNNGI